MNNTYINLKKLKDSQNPISKEENSNAVYFNGNSLKKDSDFAHV